MNGKTKAEPYLVLIMDDAPNAEILFRDVFESEELYSDYRLTAFATNKQQALTYFHRFKPHIALLDLRGKYDRVGLETAVTLHQEDPYLKIVVMTLTDVINIEVAVETFNHGFEFVNKSALLNRDMAKLYLDLLVIGGNLPLPRAARKLLIEKVGQLFTESAPNYIPYTPIRTNWRPSLTQRQVALLYRENPSLSAREMAEIAGISEDTFRRAASRLRSKLRELSFDIPEDESGRMIVVEALQKLSLI